mgnify:CR=1 FL=1
MGLPLVKDKSEMENLEVHEANPPKKIKNIRDIISERGRAIHNAPPVHVYRII